MQVGGQGCEGVDRPQEGAPAFAGSLTAAVGWWPLAWPAEAAAFRTEGQSCPDQTLGPHVPRLACFLAQRPAHSQHFLDQIR